MQTIDFSCQAPLQHQVDVLVLGGGPGGIGAAVAAARQGADVLLVEHYGFLGGMATAGEVNPFMPNHLHGQSLDTGIFEEWLQRMQSYDGANTKTRIFDPYAARLAAEDLCLEAGVQLLYHHRVAHVQIKDRHIQSVVLHSKSGFTAATAKTYIDCTGDGDVAALAGCKFEYGQASNSQCQPMTLCFKLKLDRKNFSSDHATTDSVLYPLSPIDKEAVQEAYQKGIESGEIQCPRENILIFRGIEDDLVHFNTTRVIHHSAINGQELSNAEVQARQQLRQIVKVLCRDIPLFKNARLHSIAPQIGIRESRRILGRYYVTLEDCKANCMYDDCIACITYPIDIHNPDGKGTELVHFPRGFWYGIPWRALLPRDIDNLAMGCRSISVDHAIHSSCRVMPPVCSFGQAAGTAAGMAVHQKIDLCEVNGIELRKQLIQDGRSLEHEPYQGKRVVVQKKETISKIPRFSA